MSEQADLLPMSPGEALSLGRRKAGWTRAEAARRINLSERIIQLLEEDQTGQLASVYRRGYLSSYARLLNIDPQPLIQQLEADSVEQPPLVPVFARDPRRARLEKIMKVASYLMVSVVIVPPLVWWYTQRAVDLSHGPIGQGSAVSAPAVSEPAPSHRQRIASALGADDVADSMRHMSASAAPIPLRNDGTTDGVTTDETGLTTPPLAPLTGSRLVLDLNADSWIEVLDADDRRLEYNLLRGGQSYEYVGRPPFRLLIGRASAVRLSMDGEAVDVMAHATGDVASFSLDASPDGLNRGDAPRG